MAIDTLAKRASAIATRRLPWFRRFALPRPDGSVDAGDRWQGALVYRGHAVVVDDLPGATQISILGPGSTQTTLLGSVATELSVLGAGSTQIMLVGPVTTQTTVLGPAAVKTTILGPAATQATVLGPGSTQTIRVR